jgi:hypothetical protein
MSDAVELMVIKIDGGSWTPVGDAFRMAMAPEWRLGLLLRPQRNWDEIGGGDDVRPVGGKKDKVGSAANFCGMMVWRREINGQVQIKGLCSVSLGATLMLRLHGCQQSCSCDNHCRIGAAVLRWW